MSFSCPSSAAIVSLLRTAVPSALAVCLLAAPAPAQDGTSGSPGYEEPPPAHLSVVDGALTIRREGIDEEGREGVPLVAGDRLDTARGRAEVLFPDGSALVIDENTSVEVQSSTLLRLTAGRVLLTVARTPATGDARYQIDTPAGSALLDGAGEYVVGLLGVPSRPQVELAVRRGRGELMADGGVERLRSGERSFAWADGAPSPPQVFNSARLDALDRWADLQRDARTGSRSATYLPPDLRPYSGAFDRYGAWQYDPAYGNVWYPAVDPTWRPYYNGYWTSVPRYGWTWIGLDRWAWPTHHYGRWGYGRSRWFWIPDRRWAPAWVAWGAAPGYVGWSPLGFDGRPVFGLSVSFASAWGGGWIVLPRTQFGARGYYVPRYAVPVQRLSARTAFVVQSVPPVAPRHAPTRLVGGGTSARDFGRRAPWNADGARASRGVAVPRNQMPDRTLGPGGRVAAGGAPAPGALDAARASRATRAPDAIRRDGGTFDGAAAVPRRSPPRQRFTPYGGFPAAEASPRAGSAIRRPDSWRPDGANGPAAAERAASPFAPQPPQERPGAVRRGPPAGGGWAVGREPVGRIDAVPPVSAPPARRGAEGSPAERGDTPRSLRRGGGAPGGAVYRGGDVGGGSRGWDRGGAPAGAETGAGGGPAERGSRRPPR